MEKKAYVTMRRFRSAGFQYNPGDIISAEDFMDNNKVRLGKVKVSEGTLYPLASTQMNLCDVTQMLETRLRTVGLSDTLLTYLLMEPQEVETPIEVEEDTEEDIEEPQEVKKVEEVKAVPVVEVKKAAPGPKVQTPKAKVTAPKATN